VVSRDAGIVRIQTVCVNSIYDSLVSVSTGKLSYDRPYIIDVGFALELAQTTPVVSHDIFEVIVASSTRPRLIRRFLRRSKALIIGVTKSGSRDVTVIVRRG